MLVLREERGHEIVEPPVLYQSTRADDRTVGSFAYAALPMWRESPIEPFSVALFEASDQPCHVGVVIDEGRFLHALAPSGVNAASFDRHFLGGPSWRDRLVGTYRYGC